MKAIKFIIAIVALTTAFSAAAQVGVGMRDTRFVNVNYTFGQHFNVKFEQSIFSEEPAYQSFRGYLGYRTDINKVNLNADIFVGSAWNGNFNNFGVELGVGYQPVKWFEVNGILNPYYDSSFDYKTCYRVGVGFGVSQQIKILADYGTIPEYRESEDMLRGGVNFKVGNLSFTPMLGFKARGENNFRSVRVLCNFDYTF